MFQPSASPVARELPQPSETNALHNTDHHSNVAVAYPHSRGALPACSNHLKRALAVLAVALLAIHRISHSHNSVTQIIGLRDATGALEKIPEYSTTASMINTPNKELENQLELTKGSDRGFLNVNEDNPQPLRELSKMMNIKPGTVVVVGGARSLVDVSFVGMEGATGLIQFDKSPKVTLQVRFMIELIKHSPTHKAFIGVLNEVMFRDGDIKLSKGLNDSLARHHVKNMDPEILHLFEIYLENDPTIKELVGTKDSFRNNAKHPAPMNDGFDDTVFRSEDAFSKLKTLAQKDRLATVLADLNDPDSTSDLYERAKLMGDGNAPSAMDVSNAYWEGFTGESRSFCNFLKEVSADNDELVLIMTGNDRYSNPREPLFDNNEVLKKAGSDEKGGWAYFGAKVQDVVQQKMVPSCYLKNVKGH